MHKGIAKLAVVILFLMSVGCACTSKISYSSPASLKTLTDSVVKINVDYTIQDKVILATVQKAYHATGFSFASSDNVSLIMTNQHVCSMGANANYTLITSSGEHVKATFVKTDDFADLCVLKTKASIDALKFAKTNASRGDRVTTIGGPDGVFPIIVDGIISGFHNMHLKNDPDDDDGNFEVHFRAQVMSAPVYPGSSGSPVLNTTGEVVGIVFAVRSGKEHIAFIVPISEVWRFLNTDEYVNIN